jgi:hypothetical protein
MKTDICVLSIAVALALVGGTVGPDYKRPTLSVPDRYAARGRSRARLPVRPRWAMRTSGRSSRINSCRS